MGVPADGRAAADSGRDRIAAESHRDVLTRMQSSSPKTDLVFLSLTELSELIRARKVSPVEVTRTILERIERLNPALDAFITVTRDVAMKSAQEAELEIQQKKWRGPLHGVPIAVKDLFDTAGIKTTAGSAVFKDRVPEQDAEVIRRLKSAGAVLLGKTNMHEFAFGGSSLVTYFGGVHNPWDLGRIAGGSSGGSAAAVAAGLCYGSLGSDTAGSIRNPAAYCGIVGYKPTYGLVSTRGVIPLSWTLDHVGPMTRTVSDSALLLQAIAGYDPEETTSIRMDVPNYAAALRSRPAPVRIGVAHDFYFERLEPEIATATNRALDVLRKLTAGITEVTISGRGQEELRALVRAAEAYAYHADFIRKSPELYQPETLGRLRPGANIGTVAYIQGRQQIDRTRRSIGEVFRKVDVIVTPTCPIGPPPIAEFGGDRNGSLEFQSRNIQNTSPFNVYGWPSISVPCGFTASGLPIGLQLSGPLGADAVVLQVAHAYEQATDWHKRRPNTA
ncbi:MAG: Asp-tRNA(Asn)/Glu-tRNA(Gln) amidotransferase GatCAB subunit A [Acidobacteria bacterium]|nr:MAG: Asp-tRNA(Asn)/Glu-tRNA(Gln) amidotransferase GatCAB subunit A [Acidobacteriota bacterium]